MRNRTLLVFSMVALAANPEPGWSCSASPPPLTDPCQPPSRSRSQPAETETEADASAWMESEMETVETVTVVSGPEEGEEDEEEDAEAEAACQDLRLSLQDRDPEVRRTALEGVIDEAVDLEDCPRAVDVLRARLHDENDAFLLYRTIEALGGALEEPLELLDFLEHPSVDIRRKIAEILDGEIFEPDQAERVLSAIKAEPDPWVRLAIAQLEPEGKEVEVGEVLARTVREDGPTAAAALESLWSVTEAWQPVLHALERRGAVRSVAIQILEAHAEDAQARRGLLHILEEGEQTERLHAAWALMGDAFAEEAAAWLGAMRDPKLPVRFRAGILLRQDLSDAWRGLACQAKTADPALFSLVDQVLVDPSLLPPLGLPALPRVDRESRLEGTVRGDGGASVRCATRPSGPPRPGEARLFAGMPIVADDAFTQDGVAWVRDRDGCWLPSTMVNTTGPPDLGAATGVLEADVPLDFASSERTAVAAGDLELFDPVEGYTGVRLRGASPELQRRWRSGYEGVLDVLDMVEANAQLWEKFLAQNR